MPRDAVILQFPRQPTVRRRPGRYRMLLTVGAVVLTVAGGGASVGAVVASAGSAAVPAAPANGRPAHAHPPAAHRSTGP